MIYDTLEESGYSIWKARDLWKWRPFMIFMIFCVGGLDPDRNSKYVQIRVHRPAYPGEVHTRYIVSWVLRIKSMFLYPECYKTGSWLALLGILERNNKNSEIQSLINYSQREETSWPWPAALFVQKTRPPT